MREIEKCFEYLEKGDYQKAIKSGQMAVKLYPRNINAYICLGEAYFMAGKIELAIKNFKKVKPT
ncbi:tetratricopeptide repeat protein [Calditerrivibrio sp.]|uniref:tetratricopeptide repeat protein n=1 Tax=Calditerrivibrio sp. TaxID=2792612 RepID=UPI003D0E4B55